MSSTAETPASFDGEAGRLFENHAETVRGHVRYELVRRYLEPYLPSAGGSRVLDFGGGAGQDTFWLAGLGYKVDLVDESNDYVAKAKTRLAGEPLETHQRVTATLGGIESLADSLEAYDLILSHAVLMYAREPLEQLQALERALKPGGTMSLLTKGLAGARIQAKREGKAKNLRSLEKDGTYSNHFSIPARAFSSQQVESLLKQAGFEVVAWNGVRTHVTTDEDHRKIIDVGEEELNPVVDREYEAGQSTLKAWAQLLHFVARKT